MFFMVIDFRTTGRPPYNSAETPGSQNIFANIGLTVNSSFFNRRIEPKNYDFDSKIAQFFQVLAALYQFLFLSNLVVIMSVAYLCQSISLIEFLLVPLDPPLIIVLQPYQKSQKILFESHFFEGRTRRVLYSQLVVVDFMTLA